MGYRLTSGAHAILRGRPCPSRDILGNPQDGLVEERITLGGLRALVRETEDWSGDTPVTISSTPFGDRIEVRIEDES